MMMTPHEYRAALVLNNMAVTMMERHCYRQAFETLKDALSIMRQWSTCTKTDQQWETVVLGYLFAAQRKISLPSASIRAIAFKSISLDASVWWDDFIVSFQKDSPYILLRIDSSDCIDLWKLDDSPFGRWNQRQSDYVTMILLYNFGVAHLGRAQTTSRIEHSNILRANSIKVLLLSRTFLVQLYDNCVDDLFGWSMALPAAAAVFQMLGQILSSMGRLEDAQQCARTLEQLQSTVSSLDVTLRLLLHGCRAVAGAA